MHQEGHDLPRSNVLKLYCREQIQDKLLVDVHMFHGKVNVEWNQFFFVLFFTC